MRVLIVGDVHGQVTALAKYLAEVKSLFRIGAALQLGDFGFFPHVFQEMRDNEVYFPVPLYAIDGNHEDHEWLYNCWQTREVEHWKKRHNLIYLPRASVVEIGGSKIGAIGGALHVDRPQELSPRTRASNFIQEGQRDAAIESFNLEVPELIISHTCPTAIGIGIKSNKAFALTINQYIANAGFDPGSPNDCGDRELTHLWNELHYSPRAWAFGHFHIDFESAVGETKFVCNNFFDERVKSQIVVWDTEEKSILTLKF